MARLLGGFGVMFVFFFLTKIGVSGFLLVGLALKWRRKELVLRRNHVLLKRSSCYWQRGGCFCFCWVIKKTFSLGLIYWLPFGQNQQGEEGERRMLLLLFLVVAVFKMCFGWRVLFPVFSF